VNPDEQVVEMTPEEELMHKLGGLPLVQRMLPQVFQVVDVSDADEKGNVLYATVSFVPPEGVVGSGKFNITYRVQGDEAVLVDWYGE
jgi:hypothetical protein